MCHVKYKRLRMLLNKLDWIVASCVVLIDSDLWTVCNSSK
jgi:hypothetical protein